MPNLAAPQVLPNPNRPLRRTNRADAREMFRGKHAEVQADKGGVDHIGNHFRRQVRHQQTPRLKRKCGGEEGVMVERLRWCASNGPIESVPNRIALNARVLEYTPVHLPPKIIAVWNDRTLACWALAANGSNQSAGEMESKLRGNS